MSLSLKLKLISANQVLVTNSQTQEQREVTLGFLKDITKNSLSGLVQYKNYELLLNTERYWSRIKHKPVPKQIETNSVASSNSHPKASNNLALNLQLISGDRILVTNSITQEQREVTLGFLKNITRQPLSLLVEYRTYELIINAKQHWRRILDFDPALERNKEIYLQQKFEEIMVGDGWITITAYEKQMYAKAIAWANSYNPTGKTINKGAIVATGTGAATGVLVSNTIGGVGIAAAGTAIGVGTLGLSTIGAVAGLAVYGIGKAMS